MRDYPTLHSDTDWSKGTWETMQHYTQKQIEVKEQIVVRKNMDVNEHETIQHHTQTQIEVKENERLYNITFRHTLK
jgi:hypothetical protein